VPSDNSLQLWTAYMEAYGEPDADKRKHLLEQAVADDVVFTNPGGQGVNRDDLIAHIGNFRKQMPGMYFKTDKILSHHGEFLAVWSMYKADGAPVATGYNFVQCDKDSRFRYMAGFF
jgi:hypothetical protein